MKLLNRAILVLFSLVILVLSLLLVLISTQMLNINVVFDFIENCMVENKLIVLVSGGILILISLIGLFSNSESEENVKGGLAIKDESGTVYITKDTFQNIILAVTSSYAELKNVKIDMQMNEANIVVNVFAMILPDTVVTTLTTKLKEHIKTTVKKQTTLEIKEVNIKIKGVYHEIQKK